ncbi:MAG: hypothetical protein KDI92_11850 [Xanthomonadales bacterium]|nr:hypothetical protein [Xanthomonadales bacterium]
MKKTVFLILLLFQVWAFGYEVEFSRTYNKISAEHNKLSFQLQNDGTVSITNPTFNASLPVTYTSHEKLYKKNYHELIRRILDKKTNSLSRKISLIKNQRPEYRFYSSEVDLFVLQISQDGQVLKKFEITNLQELYHYYEQLGEWQPLVDLIQDIEHTIVETKKTIKKGGEQ